MPKSRVCGGSSLAETVQTNILNAISASLADQTRNANEDAVNASRNEQQCSKPIQIRFGESGKGKHLVLPASNSSEVLQELWTDCEPALFGRGGEEVYDETYRKAGKLDTTAFTTSFSPYHSGIINVVAQMLLPSASIRHDSRGVHAKLCHRW